MRELDGAGVERAAEHARQSDIGLTQGGRRHASGGNGDRARGRALCHAGLVGQLLLLRVLDGAELILTDLLRLEDLGSLDDVLQRLGDFLWLTLILGAVEIEQLAIPLGVRGQRPFRRAAGGDLLSRAWVVSPA